MDTKINLQQIIKYEDELNDIIDKCDKLYDEECIDEIRENTFTPFNISNADY